MNTEGNASPRFKIGDVVATPDGCVANVIGNTIKREGVSVLVEWQAPVRETVPQGELRLADQGARALITALASEVAAAKDETARAVAETKSVQAAARAKSKAKRSR